MKPPFDPLKAGWIPCPACAKTRWSLNPESGYPCSACDSLGIVVGPPSDRCFVVPWIGTSHYRQVIRNTVEVNKMREGFRG